MAGEQEGAVLPDNPTQAELDASTPEQLDKFLDRQTNSSPAPVVVKPATEEKKENTAEAVETKPVDDRPEWFKKHQADLNRELKGLRSLNSLKDQVPKMLRDELTRMQREQLKNSQLQNMSPEERAAHDTQARELAALEKLIEEKAEAKLESKYGPALQFMQSEAQKQEYLGKVVSALGNEEHFQTLWPSFQALFAEKIEAIKGDDEEKAQEAEEWYKQATENPYFLIHHATRMQSKQVQDKGKAFIQEREIAGKEAGQGIRSDGVRVTGKKNLEDIPQEELDKMSAAEIDALFDEAEKAGKVKRR